MIELFEQNIRTNDRQSSKGNQLKWKNDGKWYKADYTGYEGLAEYVVSHLLQYSSLDESEYVVYELEQIKYKRAIYNGAYSKDFIEDDWQIITLERLFKNVYNQSFYESVWRVKGVDERIRFLCNQVKNLTGLKNFDKYLNKLFTLDAFFMNEDRHLHNIAVIMNSKKEFDYCRIYDNGACLLSDTTMDYPIGERVYDLMKECSAKTVSRDFDEQLDVSEQLAGENLHFYFNKKNVDEIIDSIKIYPIEIKERVKTMIFEQMRKYQYLFVVNEQ